MMKIVLCGSMSAAKEMIHLQGQLQSLGWSVDVPEDLQAYVNNERAYTERWTNKIANDLIRGHFKKIQNADAVLIVNVEKKGVAGYIGGNTFLEMGFAHVLNKPLYLLNDLPEASFLDEMKAMEPVVLRGDIQLITP